ncbi:hypothetical protein INR49_009561 [Caranx melampygus]|nr:hypothetical protein INR49_009561 [Caranx melampygus]
MLLFETKGYDTGKLCGKGGAEPVDSPNWITELSLCRLTHGDAAVFLEVKGGAGVDVKEATTGIWKPFLGTLLPTSPQLTTPAECAVRYSCPSEPGRTMADDDILFEDVYELCEVIGKHRPVPQQSDIVALLTRRGRDNSSDTGPCWSSSCTRRPCLTAVAALTALWQR